MDNSTKYDIERSIHEWTVILHCPGQAWRKQDAIKAINALNKELDTGEPHCTCHLLEYKDCPDMN